MLRISNNIYLSEEEIELTAIKSQGAGGQNVNKLATAIHLRFDVNNSSLPDFYKTRLLALKDRRINKEGVIIIKAQRYRTQEKNREDALQRLQALIQSVAVIAKARKATRPTKVSQRKRVDEKVQRGKAKALRRKVGKDEY